MTVLPAVVTERVKSRLSSSSSFFSMRSVTCRTVSLTVAPGQLRLDDHGLDGEGRIFLAAEIEIGEDAGDDEDQHEVPDQRAVVERPVGEVEPLHDAPSFGILTFWPSTQAVDAGGDDAHAGLEPFGDDEGGAALRRRP